MAGWVSRLECSNDLAGSRSPATFISRYACLQTTLLLSIKASARVANDGGILFVVVVNVTTTFQRETPQSGVTLPIFLRKPYLLSKGAKINKNLNLSEFLSTVCTQFLNPYLLSKDTTSVIKEMCVFLIKTLRSDIHTHCSKFLCVRSTNFYVSVEPMTRNQKSFHPLVPLVWP